jgi:UDP-N-acetylmuramyl pentapeptide phosphotransferase/UDP-N-acetylglucosamine-1-phosphate transferase
MSGDGVTLAFGVVLFLSAAISFGLLLWLRPLLARYALASPNARSSHKIPTPQGGGIAVIAATIIVAVAAEFYFLQDVDLPLRVAVVLAATVGLAVVGATDDIHPLEAIPRLLLQTAAVAAVIATFPDELRIIPAVPWWLDRTIVLVGGVWFVNVVNFMDGIDWMTVAEVMPVTAGLALFGSLGGLPPTASLVAFALCGAVAGFAPFNRPVAQIFLGDVGSLPIGLLLGWLLALLAGKGHFASAILLPLYYLGDATITLIRRFARGEPVTQAHRSHFYQRALDGGFTVSQIVAYVFIANVVLVGLAGIAFGSKSEIAQVATVAAGFAVVGSILWTFARARKSADR